MSKFMDLNGLTYFWEKIKVLLSEKKVTTEGTGAAYTATVPGITELTAGVNFIMIPHTVSTTTTPTLNVNGLGAMRLRQPLTTNTGTVTTAANASWLTANKPVRVMYDGEQWRIDIPRPSASTLYGVVPITSGGTGANNADDARVNLGIDTALDSKASVMALTTAEYEALETKSANTIYALTDDTSEDEVATHIADTDIHITAEERTAWNLAATGNSVPVGTIRYSARTDLDDSWILCNGSQITDDEYPVLAPMVYGDHEGKISETQTILQNVACYNGTWVAVGYASSGYYPYIYTTTEPSVTWTENQLSTTGVYLEGVACYNGTWVAVGYSSSGNYPYIYTTTDPSGTWTEKQLSTTTKIILRDVACYNGTWVAVGYATSGFYPYIYTTTDPSGTWTAKQLSTTVGNALYGVACYNGTWVTVGYASSTGYPYIYTTTDPSGTWTRKKISSTEVALQNVACYNGTWVAVGYASSGYYPYIYTTTDPSGTWTAKQLSTTGVYLRSVACYNGTWVAVGHESSNAYPYIYTATDPSGTWTAKQLCSTEGALFGVACYNGTWVAVGYSSSGGSYPFLFSKGYFLPTISAERAYVYIKAKE